MTFFYASAVALLLNGPLISPSFAGQTAPDFTLRTLEKGSPTVSLSEMKGKVLLIDFWAYWCEPCKEELPHLQKMREEFVDQGFEVWAISTDDARTKSQVKPFVKRSRFTMPVLLDTDSSVLTSYNPTKTLPFTVLIDKKGQIHSVHSGYSPGDEIALRAEVKALLDDTTP